MFKVNNKNTRMIVNFEHILDLFVECLLLTLIIAISVIHGLANDKLLSLWNIMKKLFLSSYDIVLL